MIVSKLTGQPMFTFVRLACIFAVTLASSGCTGYKLWRPGGCERNENISEQLPVEFSPEPLK